MLIHWEPHRFQHRAAGQASFIRAQGYKVKSATGTKGTGGKVWGNPGVLSPQSHKNALHSPLESGGDTREAHSILSAQVSIRGWWHRCPQAQHVSTSQTPGRKAGALRPSSVGWVGAHPKFQKPARITSPWPAVDHYFFH